jgi:hypothetical protein
VFSRSGEGRWALLILYNLCCRVTSRQPTSPKQHPLPNVIIPYQVLMAEYPSDDDEDFKRAIALSLQDANTSDNNSTENLDAVDSSDTEGEAIDDDDDFKRAIALSLQDANTSDNDSTENLDAMDSSDTEGEAIDDSKAGLSSKKIL